ncbi:MAG TPA: alanine--glyoxylate aminotransferase family protein [Candidatus Omnitrophica bacterium]|nr:alanine--glyoxylate aminotransferase family protein [Candidatus Omnitrophota bacterium]
MKRYLLTPGPTPLPPQVTAALGRPIIHHRTDEYRQLFKEVNEQLKYLFQTKQDVFTFASSGTGAMEAAVVNLLTEGEKALVVKGGKFGERWAEICEAFRVEVIPMEIEWGKSPSPDAIKEALDRNPDIKVVFTTLCETSTGAKTDICGIAEVVDRTDTVIATDAISALGAMELKMDEWGIDVVVAGSQKGIMLPPGLAFISLSEKTQTLTERAGLPSYYWNLNRYKKSIQKGETPYTPSVSLVVALREALRLIEDEGIENVWKRHALMAEATREAIKALRLELLASSPAEAVTAVKLPDTIDGLKLYNIMKNELGVQVAGGQAHLKGKIIRIAHLGHMDSSDIIIGISALETALKRLDYPVKMGAGIRAAQEVLYKSR